MWRQPVGLGAKRVRTVMGRRNFNVDPTPFIGRRLAAESFNGGGVMKPSGTALAVATLFAFALIYPLTNALAHDDAAGPRGAKLGKGPFKTTCSAEAQKQFEVALARLHSFHFPETINAFNAVTKIDSSCGIAYWGLAVANRPNPLVGPWDKATLQRGLDWVNKGESVGAKSQRERDWLAAIKLFYQDHETLDQTTRTANYEKAMERLAKKYPDDVEAQIFHALALNEVFDHKDMQPLLKAARILDPLDKKYPEHPGITHYLIHSYDFAPIAQKGIPAANKYAQIAPAAPHALHMPSHIYSMVGMWNESIQANLKSNQESVRYSTEAKLDGVLAGVPHANDFMTYAHLQLGQDQKAKALIAESERMTKVIGPVSAGPEARRAGAAGDALRGPGLAGRRAVEAARHAMAARGGHHSFRARHGRGAQRRHGSGESRSPEAAGPAQRAREREAVVLGRAGRDPGSRFHRLARERGR